MASQKGIDNWKLKKWFGVYAPKVFNEVQIGEMPGKDDKAVLGRNIKVSLNEITKNPQNTNTSLFFKVYAVDGDKAKTKLVSMELLFSYVRTIVRRYKSISTTVIKGKAKDGVEIVIKPIIVTAQRSTTSRLRGLRAEMTSILNKYVKENDSESIVKSIIDGSMQKELYTKLDHIAPINKVEIRRLEISQ